MIECVNRAERIRYRGWAGKAGPRSGRNIERLNALAAEAHTISRCEG